jgi:hypothetical protein
LLAHGLLFSPGTLASSITKTVRHDIAEILLKVVINSHLGPMANREKEANYTILYRKLKIEQQKFQSELSCSVREGSSCTTGVL